MQRVFCFYVSGYQHQASRHVAPRRSSGLAPRSPPGIASLGRLRTVVHAPAFGWVSLESAPVHPNGSGASESPRRRRRKERCFRRTTRSWSSTRIRRVPRYPSVKGRSRPARSSEWFRLRPIASTTTFTRCEVGVAWSTTIVGFLRGARFRHLRFKSFRRARFGKEARVRRCSITRAD